MHLKLVGLNRLISPIIKQKWSVVNIRTISTTNKLFNDNKVEKNHEHFDIIIAGGGMVGTTIACSLGKNPRLNDKRILLLEGAPKFKGASRETYSNRVSALSKGTSELMQSIGAWDHIVSVRHKRVLRMQVWDACSDALITFDHDQAADSIACIVENDVLLEAVYGQIESVQNVTIKNQSKILKCQLQSDGARNGKVELNNGECYSCDLLIGADGVNSMIRKQMGVNNFELNYNQMGVVATIELAEPGDNNTAWQRFLPSGPVALLPLSDSLSSLVWTTSTAQAKELLQMEPTQFVDALNEAFYKRHSHNQIVDDIMRNLETFLGSKSGTGFQLPPAVKGIVEKSRAAFPLGLGHAHKYVDKGVCLIGDSAHRVHPLAGQGVNLGFGDIKCLTNILSDAAYNGANLGNIQHLLKYEQTRLMHNIPMMIGIHGLQRLYGTDFSPLVALRSIGLRVTNALPPVKRLLMMQAMS